MKKEVFDNLVVVKRSGQRVIFNGTKIAVAIKNAFDSAGYKAKEKEVNKIYEDVLIYISNNYDGRKTINVEDIQDIIETKLKENHQLKVYKFFNDYRIRRAASRKAFELKQQHKFVKAIEKIINTNIENKNNVKPFEQLINYGKTVSNEFAKAYIIDNKYIRAHEEGNIYIHGLDYFTLGLVESTHLKYDWLPISNNTINILIKFLINVKTEVNGEISVPKINTILTPYLLNIYRQNLLKNLLKYFNICGYDNVFDLNEIKDIINDINLSTHLEEAFGKYMINEQLIKIFNKTFEESYASANDSLINDLTNLLNCINQNIKFNSKYSVSLEEDLTIESKTIINAILNIIDSLPVLENVTIIVKITKTTSKDLLTRIANLILKNKNIALMFINKDTPKEIEYFSDGKRIWENNISIGRMIISSTSINLPRIAFKNENKSLKSFYNELDDILELTKNELLFNFENIGDKCKNNYEYLFKNNILDDEKLENNQKIRKIIKNGVLNIGLVGLVECQKIMKIDDETLINILKHINKKVKEFNFETKMNFIVSETCDHQILKDLMALDKAIYGIRKDITDKTFYSKIDSKNNDNLKLLANYQKHLLGGNLIEIRINRNVSTLKMLNLIQNIQNNEMNFVKFIFKRVGDIDDN